MEALQEIPAQVECSQHQKVRRLRAIWSRHSLRRITTNGSYIAEIDGLRFVAIMSVLLFHVGRMTEIYIHPYVAPHSKWQAFSPNLLFHGARGVPLFFIISGFILGLPFAQHYLAGGKSIRLRAYFMRRLTRLEPPYIINLLLRAPLVAAAKHLTFAQLVPHLLASLLYLHVLIYASQPLIHLPSWSLEVEIQFYILAPLLAFLLFFAVFHKSAIVRRVLCLVLLAGAGFLQWHTGVDRGFGRAPWSILNYGQYFLTGFMLADLFVTSLPRVRQSWIWDVVCIPLWVAVFYTSDAVSHFWIPFFALAIYIGAFKGVLLRAFFRNTVVSSVGGMCYSIYLTHSLVLQGCYPVLMKLHFLHGFYPHLIAGVLLITPVMVFTGAIFFVLIERPCMDKNWPTKLAGYIGRLSRSVLARTAGGAA